MNFIKATPSNYFSVEALPWVVSLSEVFNFSIPPVYEEIAFISSYVFLFYFLRILGSPFCIDLFYKKVLGITHIKKTLLLYERPT